LRLWIQNKGGLESSEAIEVVAKDSFGSGIASDGIQANERALKTQLISKPCFSPPTFPITYGILLPPFVSAFCHKSMPLSFCKTLLEHNIIYFLLVLVALDLKLKTLESNIHFLIEQLID
jgi:hypothetical protein